ncbi:Bug family tripartite tricarboxylate transporter substrate binding protein [Variovorax sp. RT4R15]|uniref:Bug family tripartite tricarboxylate transporter substrate binding protein n=1 Tax=Variovorax sp. RT4R15 TaxID=3443737 RepID=UPI003F48372C
MTHTRRELLSTACVLAVSALALPARAQDYPRKPITIVVPFPPGGIADPIARLLGQKLSESLGQPVIVDSKPGAAGQVAISAVKNQPADGYTLFMGNMGSQALNPFLFSKLSYAPSDFAPITPIVQTPHWLVVHRDSPLRSLTDLIAQSKSKPGGLMFASQGVGTGGQLLAEMFKARTGIDGTHVPYKGSAPALVDLLSNRVDFFFDSVSTSLPYVKEGRLRVLAVASSKRLPQVPEIPTLAELGYPGIELSFWFGMFARTGTPDAIIHKLNAEFTKIVQSQALQEATAPIGLETIHSSPAELSARIQSDAQRWGKVIKDAKISAD